MKDLLKISRKFFGTDRFVEMCGVQIVECREGYARCEVTIADKHLNGINAVQGGLLFTIADFSAAVAAFTLGRVALSINADISFFRNCNSGTLIAEATVISATNNLCTCSVDVVCNDTKLANVKVGLFRTKQEIPEE
ncbi:MAG: PaaI family thioesterase [Salinivirgaceae bacterium]|nr:PaaI family thioesterase [Salinivirgaceae bacterium]MBR3567850.1 PaaI family thioesterase [Salinivirgaceae bacterium]MBR4621849.1 PaaI family thioesterase [Salinivirgaceae bacterium]